MNEDNPFYSNYLFSAKDLNRIPLDWTDKLRLIFRPMLCQQTSDGYIAYFKVGSNATYYLYRMEEIDG